MNTPAIRKLIDQIKEKFGDDAYLELYTDGSGFVRSSKRIDPDKLLVDFDGLGELGTILEPNTPPYPSGLNRAEWGDLS